MRKFLYYCHLVALVLFFYSSMSAQSSATKEDQLNQFTQQTGATTSLSKTTQIPNFIRFPKGKALTLVGGNLSQKVTDFTKTYGDLLGLKKDQDKLQTKATRVDQAGFKHVTTQQHYQGIPIYDGLMKFHFNKENQLTSVNGNFIPNLDLNPKTNFTLEQAKQIAINTVKSQDLNYSGAPLKAHAGTLYVFSKGLAKGTDEAVSLAYEIEVRNDRDVREYVFVNAHTGKIVEQYTGMAHALSRKLYEGNTGNQIWTEGDAFPGALDQWQQNELAAAEHSYNFFKNAFGWISYDGADAPMRTVNNDPGISCPNANWNGSTANYCTGTASDDVVAHEWGHAYTEYTCGLIYAYQSGALNESLSDVWGETIDLINGYEDTGESLILRTACSSSDRWRMGEDASSFGGAIRDMWDPTCDGDPGKVTDGNYRCGTGDSGGVHSNSGVPNHAYALLVDGGTYNGQTINGIGFVKAAHIFWQAQSVYLTKTSDFEVMADALEAACTDLLGINLEGLSTSASPAGPSGEVITVADQAELAKVLLAVELRINPDACGYQPMLAATAPLCNGASASNAIFFEDFETGLGTWTLSQIPSTPGTWTSRDWVIDNTPPDGRTGSVAFGVNPTVGNCSSDFENGIIRLESPVITIPAGTVGPFEMAFDHHVSMEDDYDGGNLKYRVNGGSWQLLPGSAFTANGYNKSLTTSGNDNPMAGQTAFSGADEGAVSGSWGQSQIDLTSLGVTAGSNVQFRWELGTDGCNGWEGWYLDDISVYSCSIPAVSFLAPSSEVSESSANVSNQCMDYFEFTISIGIDMAPSVAATVSFLTSSGGATMGADADYVFTPAQVTLDGANLTQDITVRVYDDAVLEGEETVTFSYLLNANGGDAIVGSFNQTHILTINDNEVNPMSGQVELINESFESGLGDFTMTTTGTSGFAGGNNAAATSTYYQLANTNGTNFVFVNDDACNCDLSEVRLISPTIDLTYATEALLTFDHAFSNIGGENFNVIVSTDGGASWSTSIASITNSSVSQGSGVYSVPWVNGVEVDLSAYIGMNNVKVALQYSDGSGWAYGVTVDNFKIISTQPVEVQTTTNTGTTDEQYLGPMQTVNFYDPTTGSIMATIENLSAHDYGCTTVEINRAGQGAEEAWSAATADFITSKTLQVNPGTNNPAGNYNITVFYTEAEISGWEAATGRNRSELVILKTTNDITNPQASDPREDAITSAGTFGNSLSYTASFNTGFSSFGVGPSAALPVELFSFSGKKDRAGILLEWLTLSEINSDYFVVERSTDGYSFEKIGTVNSRGNTSSVQEYHFLDSGFLTGANYYRLKQVDLNGVFQYSSTILISVEQKAEISYFPNPVQSTLSLQLSELTTEKEITAKVYNTTGQVVLEEKFSVSSEQENWVLDMTDLMSGSYFVNLTGASMVYNFKVLKAE